MKKFKLKKHNKKGFTLVELLVVIAIIAILAAIIAPNAFKAIEKSKVDKIVGDCKAIESATLNHYADTGEWPRFDGGGSTNSKGFFQNHGDGLSNWDGPYLERWPKNPFNAGNLESDYNYQLDYRIMNNEKNLVIEISLKGINNYEDITNMLDDVIDKGDGKVNGKIQWKSNNPWITWVLVKNAEGVKYKNGTAFPAHR
ncbi:prepilin-type N-terminal cleavage/methylation domain-containing protein [Haloimpatiens sp. FM7330]|uniref:prepilin-type N-terminal cleavage/methylation domain-containing protein n=1 Tax=Haloimpatiens sp. FM7330 TaxID=3298610 RepID=UPI0036382734